MSWQNIIKDYKTIDSSENEVDRNMKVITSKDIDVMKRLVYKLVKAAQVGDSEIRENHKKLATAIRDYLDVNALERFEPMDKVSDVK